MGYTEAMNDTKTSPQAEVARETARKNALQALVHTSVMLVAGWIFGRIGHPLVELVFYCFAGIAATFLAYFSYRRFASFRAIKKV